jgi:hypothetical protein
MSYLSIRNVPLAIEKAIAREAKKHNTTKTEVVVNALELVLLGKPRRSVVRRDIRSFFGQLSREEFLEFEKATKVFGKIDPADWQ